MSEQSTGAPAGSETPNGEQTGDQGAAGQQTTEQQQTTTPPAQQTGEQAPEHVVKALKDEAGKYRVERNALQKQLEEATATQQTMLDNIAKALGLKADEGADPAQQVNDLTGQVGTLSTENAQLKAELLVHTLAGEAGGNPVALLDSRTFTSKLHGLDPAAEDYRDQVATAIKDAVSTTPTLRSGQVPSAGGADTAGQGAGGADTVTAEQFKAMSYRDKTALFQKDPALYRRLNAG